MATPLPLKERVLTLSRLAGLADRHHDVWWFFYNSEGRGVDVDRYWDLANLETHGHRALCILYLTSFLSGDHKSTHVGEVLAEMEQVAMGPELVIEARDALAKIEPIVQRLTIIRSNAIAHRSRRLNHDDAYRKADLKIDDLKEIVETVRWIGTNLAEIFDVDRPDLICSSALNDLHQIFAPRQRTRDIAGRRAR
jgi:hypothetical protein